MVLVRTRQYRQTARLMLLIQFLKGTFLPCTLLVIACMAWFRRRQGYLSCDYFSVTPVFRTESMLLLKFTCILLKAPSRKHFFDFHMTRARWELHPDDIMPIQYTIHGAWHHFGFAKCSRSWNILENIHTYMHTWHHFGFATCSRS